MKNDFTVNESSNEKNQSSCGNNSFGEMKDYSSNIGFNYQDDLYHINNPKNKPIAEELGHIFSFRLRILMEPIDEINEEIRIRERLTRSLSEEMDVKIRHLDFLLRDLDTCTMGYNDSIEDRRIELHREILALEKEKRSEKLRFCEDIVSLINKRKEFLMEYRTLKSIAKIL